MNVICLLDNFSSFFFMGSSVSRKSTFLTKNGCPCLLLASLKALIGWIVDFSPLFYFFQYKRQIHVLIKTRTQFLCFTAGIKTNLAFWNFFGSSLLPMDMQYGFCLC
uniref:Uncharacterized protein n=1 Tax=Arundo donax TaxID=35708 RepID=A0A0A9DNJ1_ARUDO